MGIMKCKFDNFLGCVRGNVNIHNLWLQHLTVNYSFSYISKLQLAAEYGCCSH